MMPLPRKLLCCWVGCFLALGGTETVVRGEDDSLLPERQEPIVPVWTRKPDVALYSVAWAPDGRTLAAGGRNTIWLYRCPDFFEQAQLHADEGEVSGLAWSPDGNTLASGGRDGVIRLWVDGKIVRRLNQGAWVLDLAWEPRMGSVLVAVDDSGLIKLWDRAGTQLASIQLDGNGLALDWSPKGGFVAVSTGQNGSSLAVIDVSQSQIRWQKKDIPPGYKAPFGYGQDEVNGAAYSPDGSLIATTHQDGRLVVWQAESGRKLASVQVHGSGVAGARRVTWSPDQNWLCTCGEDGDVNLVPYPKMDYRIPLMDSSRPVWSVRFSPDGKYVAAVGDTGEIWVWVVPAVASPSPSEHLVAAPASASAPVPSPVEHAPATPHHRHSNAKSTRVTRVAHHRTEPKRHWWFW